MKRRGRVFKQFAAVTIAATTTATIVASARTASAGVPIPEADFRNQVDSITSYGLTHDAPFVGISLDDESMRTINERGQEAFGMACSALISHSTDIGDVLAAALRGYPNDCSDVVMGAIRQEQQWQYAQNPFERPTLMGVVFYPAGYWGPQYPYAYVAWYPW